jgi:hypothetical protein
MRKRRYPDRGSLKDKTGQRTVEPADIAGCKLGTGTLILAPYSLTLTDKPAIVGAAHGAIAQLGERLTGSQEVGGSTPPGSTKIF